MLESERNAGMTLIQLMVGIAIGSIALMVFSSAQRMVYLSQAGIEAHSEFQQVRMTAASFILNRRSCTSILGGREIFLEGSPVPPVDSSDLVPTFREISAGGSTVIPSDTPNSSLTGYQLRIQNARQASSIRQGFYLADVVLSASRRSGMANGSAPFSAQIPVQLLLDKTGYSMTPPEPAIIAGCYFMDQTCSQARDFPSDNLAVVLGDGGADSFGKNLWFRFRASCDSYTKLRINVHAIGTAGPITMRSYVYPFRDWVAQPPELIDYGNTKFTDQKTIGADGKYTFDLGHSRGCDFTVVLVADGGGAPNPHTTSSALYLGVVAGSQNRKKIDDRTSTEDLRPQIF